MLTTCPWGYPPHSRVCQGCTHDCALREDEDRPLVLNGMAGVWEAGGSLILENSCGERLQMLPAELDSYIALLQAAQQELIL